MGCSYLHISHALWSFLGLVSGPYLTYHLNTVIIHPSTVVLVLHGPWDQIEDETGGSSVWTHFGWDMGFGFGFSKASCPQSASLHLLPRVEGDMSDTWRSRVFLSANPASIIVSRNKDLHLGFSWSPLIPN